MCNDLFSSGQPVMGVVEVPVPQQEVLQLPGLPSLRLQRAQQDRGEAVQVGEGLQQAGNGLKMLLGGVKE